MNVYKITVDLPDKYAALLGAVIVHWSYQEQLLADLTNALLNIGPKHGRIAVRSPRADEYVSMIQQLMLLEKVTCDPVDLDQLGKDLKELQTIRDCLAHGVWFLEPNTGLPAVQRISGNWKPDPKGPKVARRITPEGIVIDEKGFSVIIKALKATIGRTHKAHEEIAAKLEASRKKHP